jgi:hypothetical protein
VTVGLGLYGLGRPGPAHGHRDRVTDRDRCTPVTESRLGPGPGCHGVLRACVRATAFVRASRASASRATVTVQPEPASAAGSRAACHGARAAVAARARA